MRKETPFSQTIGSSYCPNIPYQFVEVNFWRKSQRRPDVLPIGIPPDLMKDSLYGRCEYESFKGRPVGKHDLFLKRVVFS